MSDTSSHFFARAGRFFRHVRNGTLLDRLHFGWEASKRERYVGRWQRGMERAGYVDCPIAGKAMLRLYADSRLSEEIYFRDFEIKERLFLRRYLRQEDVFVDIGANIGLFAVEAAVAVGKKGKIFAFEPNPKTYTRLQENVRLNRFRNITAVQMAVSSEQGSAELIVSTDGYDAWSSFGKPIAGESFENIEVPVTTLADFVQSNSLDRQIAMIKIDVEGWEASVLRGGYDYLLSPAAPLLQVEFTQLAALNANSSCEQLFQMLCGLGYSVCKYDPLVNCLHMVERNMDWEYENLFATKSIAQANKRLQLSG